MRTRVKICGVTRAEDALGACRAGADALGLVFYPPSPRNVSIASARAIVEPLPPFVTIVGLSIPSFWFGMLIMLSLLAFFNWLLE